MRLIVVSAPEDESHRRALERHLTTVGLPGSVEAWHMGLMAAGTDVQAEIEAQVEQAELALVLLSSDLSAAETCQMILHCLLREQQSRPLQIVPVLVRPVEYQDGPLSTLQMLPGNGLPVTSWSNVDQAWQDVARSIKEAVFRRGDSASKTKSLVMPSSPEDFYHSYALVIGVGGESLPGAESDARAIGQFLAHPLGGGYHHVCTLIGTDATKQRIMESLRNIAKQASEDRNAMVLLFFSGLGGRFLTIERLTEYYLFAADSDPNDPLHTMISGKELSEEISRIKASFLLVLLDCCHSGGMVYTTDPDERFVNSMADRNMIEALQKKNGRVIIASSRENESSYNLKNGDRGIFTHCLLDALHGKASINKDGYSRIFDIVNYISNMVPMLSDGRQHPVVRITGVSNSFPVCYYAGGKKDVD